MTTPAKTVDQKLHISQTLPKSQLEENEKNDLTQTQTQTQTDSKPNKTPKTGIAYRAIKCVGKVLLGVFTVPTMATLTTLSEFVNSVANSYHSVISPVYEDSKICALILSVTIMPPFALAIGTLSAISGFFYGIEKGINIARNFSLEPLKSTWTDMKASLLGERAKEINMEQEKKIDTYTYRLSHDEKQLLGDLLTKIRAEKAKAKAETENTQL